MHGPMLQGSVHNSWKLKTSQFLHGQHTHRTCHPLSMFWIWRIQHVFQFLPISSNFTQAIEEEWTNIPQAKINNLINSMGRRCVALHWGKWWSFQILTGFRIFERNRPLVYIEKVLDLFVQLMKNGGKNKSVAFIICQCVYIYIYIYIFYYSVAETKNTVSQKSEYTPHISVVNLVYIFKGQYYRNETWIYFRVVNLQLV